MRVGTYKNRQYEVLYLGSTKYGPRAKLGFFDGTKTFWVDGPKVSGVHHQDDDDDGMCWECGERRATTTGPDSSGIMGRICGRCASYSRWERSYM